MSLEKGCEGREGEYVGSSAYSVFLNIKALYSQTDSMRLP
ncbi:3448_t:CDS:2 [Rhizophagus irregularis]|nr:3448_t:CDS:2 [Rhizophagus irregularis]